MERAILVTALCPRERDLLAEAIAFQLGEDPQLPPEDRGVLEALLEEVFDAEHAERQEAAGSSR